MGESAQARHRAVPARGSRCARVILCLALATPALAAAVDPRATPAQLNCDVGPIDREFGRTHWLVYSCDDGHSVMLVAAPSSPAAPFIFSFLFDGRGVHLRGEGTGDKSATDAAYTALKDLKDADLAALIRATRSKRAAAPRPGPAPAPSTPPR